MSEPGQWVLPVPDADRAPTERPGLSEGQLIFILNSGVSLVVMIGLVMPPRAKMVSQMA